MKALLVILAMIGAILPAAEDPWIVGPIPDRTLPEGGDFSYPNNNDFATIVGPFPVTSAGGRSNPYLAVSWNDWPLYHGHILYAYVQPDEPGSYAITIAIAGNATGRALFTVIATDFDGGNLGIDTFTVTITARPDPPVLAANTGLAVDGNQETVITAANLQLTSPDNPDPEDVDPSAQDVGLHFTLTALPSGGVLRRFGSLCQVGDKIHQSDIDRGWFTYQHTPGAGADDAFSATYNDDRGIYADAGPIRVLIRIAGTVLRVDTAWIGTLAGLPRTVALQASNPGASALAWSLTAGPDPAQVAVALAADGTCTVTPAAGFAGLASLAVAVSDGSATAAATVPVVVTGLGAPQPWAVSDPVTSVVVGESFSHEVAWDVASDFPASDGLRFSVQGDVPAGLALTVIASDRVRLDWTVPLTEPADVHRSFLLLAEDGTNFATGVYPVLLRILPRPQSAR